MGSQDPDDRDLASAKAAEHPAAHSPDRSPGHITRWYQVGTGSTTSRHVAAQLARMFRDLVDVRAQIDGPVLERWRPVGKNWQREM